jgi:nitrite reductase/ring-hydroxylating ferredoxin subunit
MSEFVGVMDVGSLAPGHGRTVHVRGREFAVFNVDGEFCAIDNTCPHKGGPLGAGTLENGQVFCPLHGWAFDVKSGACLTRSDRPVQSYPTRVQAGEVQIDLSAHSPLESHPTE